MRRASEVVGLDQPATTTEASATSATASRHLVTTTVRVKPADVDDRHGADRRDTDEPGVVGPQVGAGGERERDARGGLADDEAPPGEVPPDRPELTTGVHVRAARLGVHGGQLGRGRGVAERDDRGDHEADQERRSRPRPRPGPRR